MARRLVARGLLALAAWLGRAGQAVAAAPADPLAALRARYPDAPEAWLRLIAARAGQARPASLRRPHLPEAAPVARRPRPAPAPAAEAAAPVFVVPARPKATPPAPRAQQPPAPVAPPPHLHFTATAGRLLPHFGPAPRLPVPAGRPVPEAPPPPQPEAGGPAGPVRVLPAVAGPRHPRPAGVPPPRVSPPPAHAAASDPMPDPGSAPPAARTTPAGLFPAHLPSAPAPQTWPCLHDAPASEIWPSRHDAPARRAAPAPVAAAMVRATDPQAQRAVFAGLPATGAPQVDFHDPLADARWPALPPAEATPAEDGLAAMPARWAAPRSDQEARQWSA